jgi:hypothetical protein
VPVTATLSAAGPHPLAQLSTNAGAAFTPARWFSLALEVDARFGPLNGFEQLSPGVGARFAVKRVGIELDAVAPVAGSSRYTAAGALRVAYRY